ncbi:MAG TPA: L-dopachrome tautomerase-related protein [Myxococcaceae bacterium]|nr:L-dopachrome tautomerase-related protein [Myxococcaceae bacterium]
MSPTTLALLSLLAAAPPTPVLERVAELPERPGAIAVVGTRLFVALHPLGAPETKLLELLPGGRRQPYPSGVLSRSFTAVTALDADVAGGLWILDAGGEGKPARLTGWNIGDERRIRALRIPVTALGSNSWLCALAVDRAHQVAFVADRSRADWTGDSHPALLVVSLESGETRRLLEDHPALEPDAMPITVDRRPLAHRELDGTVEKLRLGVGQLALDPAGTFLYLAALNGGAVWRVRTRDLLDPALAPEELATRVESYAERPSGTGLVAWDDGRVVLADVENHALRLVSSSAQVVLVQDSQLQWPDGLARGPEDWVYVTVNQLNLHPALNRGEEESRPPYGVFRTRVPRGVALRAPAAAPSGAAPSGPAADAGAE